jgi:hypothetical protein
MSAPPSSATEPLYDETERKCAQAGQSSPFPQGFLESIHKAANAPNGQPTRRLLGRWGESALNATWYDLRTLLVKSDRADCVEAVVDKW